MDMKFERLCIVWQWIYCLYMSAHWSPNPHLFVSHQTVALFAAAAKSQRLSSHCAFLERLTPKTWLQSMLKCWESSVSYAENPM